MKVQNKIFSKLAFLLTVMTISSTVCANILPLENRLPAWDDYGTQTVDFTDVNLFYKDGDSRWGKHSKSRFFATSSRDSEFSLNNTLEGYDNVDFNGYMYINAKISSAGEVLKGSTFGFYSADERFGAEDEWDYKNVYSGDLTSFGWSGSAGIIEFGIGNLDGWAMDAWHAGEPVGLRTEHLMLSLDAFDFNDTNRWGLFTAHADGFAVVPVPAAVWLFGSGLIGLVGFARRKKA